jgi:EAL domain-containing protein (putative c-di-GMP-specific phosphodiesterase class I)
MDVIAEGIENEDQLEILRRVGCAFGQGYLISYPMSKDNAELYLIEHVLSFPKRPSHA